jgi:hypothetical protein
MRTLVIILSAVTLAGGAAAAVLFAADDKRPLPAELGDVSAARAIEVKDAAGRTVLHGELGAAETADDGDVERKATLAARDGSGASGEAEIEVSRSSSGAVEQEVEIDVEKLSPSATYTLLVDGRPAATFTTDDKGGAEVELASAGGR